MITPNRLLCILLLNFMIFTTSAHAGMAQIDFQNLFTHWTNAFNNKNLATSCNLFAKSVVANYQGVKAKNYQIICQGFKKIFQQKNRRYVYRYKIHNIYRERNLAAVRITWYLDIYENDKLVSATQDEGLDILAKQPSGKWQIINYLGYPVNHA